MDLADEIAKLEALRREGTLTDAQFEEAKAAAIKRVSEPPPPHLVPLDPIARERKVQDLALWIHLSNYASFLIPYGGLILPFILWKTQCDLYPEIDPHGKAVANWAISKHIYFSICAVLAIFCIGFLLMIPLGIIALIYPIIGAVKAGKNEVFNYPGSIPFFR